MALTLEWRHRIMAWREELSKHFYLPVGEIALEGAFTRDQYRFKEAVSSLTFSPMAPGDGWGAKWQYGWFKGGFTLPDLAANQMIAIMLNVGGEAVVYIDGDYAGAMDREHRTIIITDCAQAGRTYELVLEAYAGHGPQVERSGPTSPDHETVPEPPDQQCVLGQSTFGIWQEVAFQLAMDVETLWEVRENIDANALRVTEIDEGLRDFTYLADFEAPHGEMLNSLQVARERLKPLLDKHNSDTTPEMVGFGHAHIDVAWLWPLAETERKCVRTFSNQLALMERYPAYKFFQSQPQLYVMVREKYPDLYQKIRAAVEQGQWIAEGAAWVEPDTNLAGGESLIRQLVHGKRFFRDEFDVDCKLLWLPDVFGYSGALPQIMLGCGVPYFSTQKIFWAYHGGEAFPYNTFIWEGIDGSQVKAHFHNDYNSEVRPSALIQRWDERVQKDGFSVRLFPFGHGDGGGGATREHLEFALRLKDLEGVPKFSIDDPMTFFTAQDEAGWPQDRYVGELYLQVHRGTYTSQARTKALNRRCELALREVELWGCAAMALKGFEFPWQQLETDWKTVLLNQFHDILPGSSIARVYREAEAQLSGVLDHTAAVMQHIGRAMVDEPGGITVLNSLSWPRVELVELPAGMEGLKNKDGEPVPIQTTQDKTFAEVHLPACGWVSYERGRKHIPDDTLKAGVNFLENDLVRVEFNACGEITSMIDKANQCELTAGVCNQFKMYRDIPSAFDAWDIDSMYRQEPVELDEPAVIEVFAEGPLFARLVVRRKFNHSTMTQTISLCRNSRRLDFHTVIDWQERHKLLKVNFPVNYFAHQALHEIQFGHLARPTHRSRQIDRDRFEVCNHKWTALVEGSRGFAVLNDSKYGVDVLDNSINLTLLKAALAPDMTADRGRQEFTYAIYFWQGSLIESGLVQEGYQLNVPPRLVIGQAGTRTLFTLDQTNIILETVKPPEDGAHGDMVLRLYEAMGTRTRTRLSTSLPITAAYLTNMLETPLETLEVTTNGLDLEFRPFEIKTLRLTV